MILSLFSSDGSEPQEKLKSMLVPGSLWTIFATRRK